MKLQFFSAGGRDASHPAAASARLINFYREPLSTQGRTSYVLRSVAGTEQVGDVMAAPVRAMHSARDAIWIISAGHLWSLTSDGSLTLCGDIPDDPETAISSNGDLITITAGGLYFVWDGTAASQPTEGEITAFGAVEYLSGYTIHTERGGTKYGWSAPFDAENLPVLNFDSASLVDDKIVRPVVIGSTLWVLKERSMEAFALTGQAGALAFDRITGAAIERGLKAFQLLCKIPSGAFFVGDDGAAYVMSSTMARVSTPAVEHAIAHETPISCHYYEDRGRGFACITLKDAPAWCLDLQSGEWHERATLDGPWRITHSARLGDAYFGATSLGEILRYARVDRDGGDPLIRTAVSATLDNDGAYFRLAEVEIFGRFGDAAGEISLAVSDDYGRTFGRERIKPLPVPGHHAGRVRWHALGAHRAACVRLRLSTAADISIDSDGRLRTG